MAESVLRDDIYTWTSSSKTVLRFFSYMHAEPEL